MEIRHLKTEELPELQSFINKFWRKDHILATNRALMNYQHFNGNHYNWIIAKDTEIQVILGFVPTWQYDAEIKRTDIWLCIWMRSDKELPKGTGTKLLDYLEDYYHPNTVAAIGINDKIEQLYLKRGWQSGVLNHYYFVSPGKIAAYKEGKRFEPGLTGVGFSIPQKSLKYVEKRYFKHPFYAYKAWKLGGFSIITRKISVMGGACLRIVDCFTENEESFIECSPYAFHDLCMTQQVDYIDMVTNRTVVPRGLEKKPADLILPNWFEPFVQGDKPIKYAHNGGRLYEIHKGDADQDRPSRVSKLNSIVTSVIMKVLK